MALRRRVQQTQQQTPRRPRPLPDHETQIDPLQMQGQYIPTEFKYFLQTINRIMPELYFTPWPYQVKLFDKLFEAWAKRKDVRIRQCRQSGKTVPTAFWMAYMIVKEYCQEVVVSTKVQKTRKITRIVQRIMARFAKDNNIELSAEGIDETRYVDSAGYASLSGKAKAERESETGHIILVDEGQDIPADPTLGDLSPMRAGTGGIMIVMGIGGLIDENTAKCSLLAHVEHNPDWLALDVKSAEVIRDRPTYQDTVDKDRKIMLPHIFRANYELENFTSTGNQLLPYIQSWKETFGSEWNPRTDARHSQRVVGIDWGNKLDASALTASALRWESQRDGTLMLTECVVYKACWFGGVTPDLQIDMMVEELRKIEYNVIRPEMNHLGDHMAEMLYSKLLEAGLLNEPNSGHVAEGVWQPIYADKPSNRDAAQSLAMCSCIKRFFYTEDDGHMTAAINNLRSLGVKYSLAGDMQVSHSDWYASLRAAAYPTKIVTVS